MVGSSRDLALKEIPALLTTMADLSDVIVDKKYIYISRLRHLQSSYEGAGTGEGRRRFLQGSDRKGNPLYTMSSLSRKRRWGIALVVLVLVAGQMEKDRKEDDR